MPRSLHYDLRCRVLKAIVDEGLSCREAASRFGVSASSAIRWAALRRDALWAAIGRLVDQITPTECANMFAAAGYDAI